MEWLGMLLPYLLANDMSRMRLSTEAEADFLLPGTPVLAVASRALFDILVRL